VSGTGGTGGSTVGARLRLARQVRGLSQQQLAGMADVTRQALSAIEAGHSDPSLRVALAVSRALGMTVEELFGPGDPPQPVPAVAIAGVDGPGTRVTLAPVGDTFVALPLRGDLARSGFAAAGGLVRPAGPVGAPAGSAAAVGAAIGVGSAAPVGAAIPVGQTVLVEPIGPPRPTLVVAGCDPALPLLEMPLALLDPPVAFAWWPCGSGEALDLAERGLVHAAGTHSSIPAGTEVARFSAWREGLVLHPSLAGKVDGLDDVARLGIRLVNREPGAEARRVLDAELERLGLDPADLPGYETRVTGHLQVAAAIAAGLAGAGVASEPAALAYGLMFIPLADERFDLVLPARHLGSREVQALLRVLASPWLAAQLASIPGYAAARN
jgi:putative molybdopterin biosynthesis protein